MSRDSSRTYIHLHSPHHADLFEDFSTPPSSNTQSDSTTHHSTLTTIPWSTNPSVTANPSGLLSTLPLGNHPTSTGPGGGGSSHFPPEDILIPLHLLPPNPEDEDDMVPDQHAAFGISRALAGSGEREHGETWRDFGSLGERVRGLELREREPRVGGVGGTRVNGGVGGGEMGGEQQNGGSLGGSEQRR